MSTSVPITFDPRRGYIATRHDGAPICALSLDGLRRLLPRDARLVLDKAARAEQRQRRHGGVPGSRDSWPR